MKISIIIVHYNTTELLATCLDSIIKKTNNVDYEIIVIDNNSPDRSCLSLQKKYPQVTFIFLDKNLGYGGANNYGFRIAKGEYIFILNPDTSFVNNVPFLLYDFMKTQKYVGIIGPKLLNPDLTFQRSYGKFFSIYKLLFELFHLYNIYSRLTYYLFERRKINEEQSITVDWVTGAALMIPRDVYKRLEGFDCSFFLYSEEMDLCARVKKIGLKIVYFPSAKLIHLRGASTSKKPYQLIINRYQGIKLFANKHLTKKQKFILRSIIFCGLVFRIFITKYIPIYSNVERKKRLEAYIKVLNG